MATQALDLAAWKARARGKPWAQGDCTDVLAAWARAAGEDAARRLDVLDDLDEALDDLRAVVRRGGVDADEREVLEWVADAERAVENERRKALADKADDVEDDYDFDNDLRALTTLVAAMLRQVRRGSVAHVLLARHGRDHAVRLARRPLQNRARELLATYLGSEGGVRYDTGTCHWEHGAYTFVLRGSPNGRARPLRAALLRQTGKRHPVRVRGLRDDGSEEPADEALEDLHDDTTGPAVAPAQVDAQAATQTGSRAETPTETQAEIAWQAQRERLVRLVPRLRRALLTRPAEARRLRPLIAFAQLKVQRRQTVAARQSIDSLERLLEDAGILPTLPIRR